MKENQIGKYRWSDVGTSHLVAEHLQIDSGAVGEPSPLCRAGGRSIMIPVATDIPLLYAN